MATILSTNISCLGLKLHYNATNFNTLRPMQNGRHFPDGIFKRIFLNQNVRIPINISLEFVPKGPINNILALVQIIAWRRPGDKPLSETMLVSLLTHICVTRPQWINPQAPDEFVKIWLISIQINYSNKTWFNPVIAPVIVCRRRRCKQLHEPTMTKRCDRTWRHRVTLS